MGIESNFQKNMGHFADFFALVIE